jgi:hypothetical protein
MTGAIRRVGRSVALLLSSLACALLIVGCIRSAVPPMLSHGSYAGMKIVADKYAALEIEQLTTGYFGTPLHPVKGAHVAAPVPVHSVRMDTDVTRPLLSRLEPWVDTYTIPVLNSSGDILGEYQIGYRDDSQHGDQGWQFWEAGREGVLTRDLEAKKALGLSPESTTTLIDSGAVWSVVSTSGTERGVAPRVIFDHNTYASLPDEGRVYEGDALRSWFTPKARGW